MTPAQGGAIRRATIGVRCLATIGLVAALSMLPAVALAVDGASVDGKGTGVLSADLDGDGQPDGARFSLNAALRPHGSEGFFQLVLPMELTESEAASEPEGEFPPPLDADQFAVDGLIEGFGDLAEDEATFGGFATVYRGTGGTSADIPFRVVAVAGGPDEGTLTFTLLGVLDGSFGDAEPGNGHYDSPLITLVTGEISVDLRPEPEPSPSPTPTPTPTPSPRD